MKVCLRILSLALITLFAYPLGAHSRYDMIARVSIDPTELTSALDFNPRDVAQAMRPPMSAVAKYFTVLNLFGAHDTAQAPEARFITPRTWNDFQIFPSLLQSIDRTETIFGKATLAGMLVEDRPNTDVGALQRKQQIIKTLLTNPELMASIEQTLAQWKQLEPFFVTSFSGVGSTRQQALSEFYSPRAPHDWSKLQFVNKLLDDAEKSPGWHLQYGFGTRLAMLLGIVGLYGTAEGLWKWMSHDRFGFQGEYAHGMAQGVAQARAGFSNAQILAGISGLCWTVWQGLRFLTSEGSNAGKITQLPFDALINTPKQMKSLFTTHKVLQEDFAQLNTVLTQLRPLAQELRGAGVARLVPECADFFALCENPKLLSKDLDSLLSMLKTGTFKGKYSIFSHFGRLFAANHLMRVTAPEWSRVLKAIGYLDAYVSLAKLMRESEAKSLKFCFPEFIERAKPLVELKSFWHPIVGADKAVANDVTFGDPAQNIILTGPFAAGKSTIMRGMGIAVLMAQNLGIAPATSMKLTPFAMINTSMNISDNLANNLSGFASELAMAQYFMKKISGNTGFSLNIFDELFRATSDADAERTLYSFAKKLAIPSALNIFATHKHTDKIIGLEKECATNFANFKVESPDGKNPDYKLKRGWTRQSLLLDSTLAQYGLA